MDIPPVASVPGGPSSFRQHRDGRLRGSQRGHRRRAGRAPVIGVLAAGAAPEQAVEPGTAIQIMTGAPDTRRRRRDRIVERTEAGLVARHGPNPRSGLAGAYVRPAGSDLHRGDLALAAGTVIGPAARRPARQRRRRAVHCPSAAEGRRLLDRRRARRRRERRSSWARSATPTGRACWRRCNGTASSESISVPVATTRGRSPRHFEKESRRATRCSPLAGSAWASSTS